MEAAFELVGGLFKVLGLLMGLFLAACAAMALLYVFVWTLLFALAGC